MSNLIFDVETSALDAAYLESIMPPFDPSEVKLGNVKDEAKIAAKLIEAEQAYKQSFIDNAALDALTGKVLAIGIKSDDEFHLIDGEESSMLEYFWKMIKSNDLLVGFNVCQFDLPFLYKRSWHHGITPPSHLRRGKWWSDSVVDLRDVWTFGDKYGKGNLDTIAKHLGLGGKTGNGKDFAQLWDTDRDKAIAYLKNDVELTEAIAKRMGVVC